MSKAVLVTIIGIIVAFVPFTGFPSGVRDVVVTIAGVIIVTLGLLMRVERLWLLRSLSGGHKTDAYAENSSHTEASREL
jgi:sulfite exporter TauE/SafE